MPWKEQTPMSQRQDFVIRASQEGVNMRQLCQEYGISRKTGYKWLKRHRQQGDSGLVNQSSRPHHSPTQTALHIEELLLRARDKHPAWGARKLKAWLQQRGDHDLPAVSTISQILKRHGCIDPVQALQHRPYRRFEYPQPNDLWQMDFKGEIALQAGRRCYPLTVLDDHSRFLLALLPCPDQTGERVQSHLTGVFRTFGLPLLMLMDNGSPWGNTLEQPHTALSVWLMRLGIRVVHGRPYHPQTQGKVERLHRTLQEEMVSGYHFSDLAQCHLDLAQWRELYNQQRPHEALQDQPPASRYHASQRSFPESLPPICYEAGEVVRRVQQNGKISFRGRACRVGKAFRGQPVVVRPDPLTDGVYEVYFLHTRIAVLDFNRQHYPLS
jgi:transposase InsO family protein